MTIKIEMLRCFTTVAEAGNLLDAAGRLGRTQSALSMTLKQLEDHLGQRLFANERKNKLTPLGQQVFDLARQQLQDFDYTIRAIETSANSPDGLVLIASIPTVAGLVFPKVLETVLAVHPGLKVDLRDMDSQAVIDALARGHVDLGVASGNYALNGIERTSLFSDPLGLICAPIHPLAGRLDNVSVEELHPGQFVNNNLCNQIEDHRFREFACRSKVSVQNTSTLLSMVETGQWVTILPKTVIQMISASLVFREIAELSDEREVFLYRRNNPAFEQFVALLSDELIRQVNSRFNR